MWWWTVLRIVSPALVFIHPIGGFLFCFVLDAVDGDLFEKLSLSRKWYQQWDKYLDLWFQVVLLFYVFWVVSVGPLLAWFIFWFGIRIIGTVLFSLSNNESLLFIFPNVFTELFLVYFLFPAWLAFDWIVPAPWPMMILLGLISLVKEWWFHIAKIDLTDLVTGKRGSWNHSKPSRKN